MTVVPNSRYDDDPNDRFVVGNNAVGKVGFATWAAFSILTVFGVPTIVGYLVFTQAPMVGGAWWPYIRFLVTAVVALVTFRVLVSLLAWLSIVVGIAMSMFGGSQ